MWYMIFSRPGGGIYFSINSLLCELLFFSFFLLLSKFHAPLKWTTKSNFILSQDLHFYQIRWYKEMIILVFLQCIYCNKDIFFFSGWIFNIIKRYFGRWQRFPGRVLIFTFRLTDVFCFLFLTELISLPCTKTSQYVGNESVFLFIAPRNINSRSVKIRTQLIFINIIA